MENIISKDTMLAIISDGCHAPSGDNTQPWRFAVRQNQIAVWNITEKDNSPFNWQQAASHIALGACVENIRISAAEKGYLATIQLFPSGIEGPVAEVSLSKEATGVGDLSTYIRVRASNRRKYRETHIEESMIAALTNAAAPEAEARFITDKELVKKIARIVSVGERLALENRDIHDFLFSHITWSKKEDKRRNGFFVDTFEFSPPQKAAFKLFSSWSILRLFLPLGISKIIARDMEKVHASSAAFGVLLVKQPGSIDTNVRVGIALERLWLTAAKNNLALQPTTAVHFLGTRIREGEPGNLTEKEARPISMAYEEMESLFGVSPALRIAFSFRIGYADEPSAVTTRAEPLVEFET